MSTRRTQPQEREQLGRAVGRDAQRIARRKEAKSSPLLGLATLGMVGWSVVVPMLLGIAAGVTLDERYPQPRLSWTLTLMFVGLGLGIFNAIYWVDRERRRIERECELKRRG